MSDYVKSTNFASKDSLPTGNPSKIVKGTEIDTEFNNIATAVATKADINSPALVGTPTAPTASVGTDSTQLATTAYVIDQIANDAPKKDGTGATGSWSINAATATAAQGSTFATQSTTGEGQLIARKTGKNDAYLFNGDTAWGLYSASGGTVVSVNHSTGAASFSGTATNATNTLGNGQTWQSVARANATTYTNSTGKPIVLQISASGPSSGNVAVTIEASINSGPNVMVLRTTGASGYAAVGTGSIVIPIGATYVLTHTNVALASYWELR